MDLVVRAFPLRSGDDGDVKTFARRLREERPQETRDFYARYGVKRETWHVQHTTSGPWVICVTEMEGRSATEAGAEFQAADDDFDAWFKEQVFALTGSDPNREPLGPPTHSVFDSSTL